MQNWQREIEELHAVFEAYFLGTLDSLERVEQALADDFTIVQPNGVASSRTQTLQALRAGHGHTESLKITVTEPVLLFVAGETVVARYIENHDLTERNNHRLSTVVFTVDPDAPNGLVWRCVHETWLQ